MSEYSRQDWFNGLMLSPRVPQALEDMLLDYFAELGYNKKALIQRLHEQFGVHSVEQFLYQYAPSIQSGANGVFTRASAAYDPVTFSLVNSEVPRYRPGDGVFVEEGTTNLLTAPNDFSAAAWGKSNVNVNPTAELAPDGSATAWTMVEDTANAAADEHWADLYLEGSDQHRGWFHSSLS